MEARGAWRLASGGERLGADGFQQSPGILIGTPEKWLDGDDGDVD